MYLTIIGPTRVTTESATLIDNIYLSENLAKQYHSLVLIEDMSDHFPCVMSFNKQYKKHKMPLKFKCHKITDENIATLDISLSSKNWDHL